MPIEWDQDPESQLVVVEVVGKVPAGAYLALWDELIADPRIEPGPRIVADFSAVEVTQTGADVRGVAAGAMRFKDFMAGGRMAIVATQQASFGLARMYATLVEGLDFEVQVFRDYDEAREWALASSERARSR